MKVMDVSRENLNTVYLFCKVHERIYDFALEHKNGKTYLIMVRKA